MKDRKHISLTQLDKTTPFKIPENYFEGLPMSIQEKATYRKASIFPKYFQLYVAVSAISAIFVIALLLFENSSTPTLSTDQLLSEVHENTLLAYLEDAQLDEEEFINDYDLTLSLDNNILSNESIQNQSLKDYEENYLLELDDYDNY